MAEGWTRQYLTEKNLMRENIVVASVALDAKAVHKDVLVAVDRNRDDLKSVCCGDKCDTVKERKAVKDKAIKTMQSMGVNMKGAMPKTWDELLPILIQAKNQEEADIMLAKQLSLIPASSDILAKSHSNQPEIDRLIVLCSCGDDMKSSLGKISQKVEEWNVDAPTAMSKAGEGDSAYTRVSLEIKAKVHHLMSEVLN